MERKVLFYWMAQLLGWGAYYILSVLLLFVTNDFRYTTNLFLWVLSSIALSILISHGVRFVILSGNWLAFKLGKLVVYSIVVALLAASALELFQHLLDYVIPTDFLVGNSAMGNPVFDWGKFFFAVSRSTILFMLWLGFYYSFVIIEKSRKTEIANLQFLATQNEIELKNLRAQLNPHFLFNSLNSIRALVGLDPEQAKSAITKLSSLLRQSINLGKLQVVALKDELELVKSYLDLEQIRFEERLNIQLEISEDSLKCEIPPLMVQTLVENAIKHGISKSIDGGSIQLKSSYTGNRLHLEIRNTGQLQSSDDDSGVGVSNTKKRLEILYGERATFDIREDGNEVVVVIDIQYI